MEVDDRGSQGMSERRGGAMLKIIVAGSRKQRFKTWEKREERKRCE